MLVNWAYYLLTAFGIGLIIFVHELGHFLAARAVGIRVDVFSIGFGRRIWGFRRGPTDYRLSIFPLGGYVKMAGEDPTRPTTGDPEEFGSKKVWQRILVISAGVIMNVIFALIVIPIAFAIGVPFDAPVVGGVTPGTPAWKADVRPGDRVLAIDGKPILGFEDIINDAAIASDPVDVKFQRDGRVFHVEMTPRPDPDFGGLRTLGIAPKFLEVRIPARQFEDDGPPAHRERARVLSELGLSPEDRVTALNDLPYSQMLWTSELLRARVTGDPVRLKVVRDGSAREVALPRITTTDPDARWVGVYPLDDQVDEIKPGGAGERLGLRTGDVLQSINGEAYLLRHALGHLVGEGRHPLAEPAGGQPPYRDPAVRFEVVRDGAVVPLSLELATPAERAALIQSFSLKSRGVRISVIPGAPADRAGFRSGDLIKTANGKEIKDFGAFTKIVIDKEVASLEVVVERDGKELPLHATPDTTHTEIAAPRFDFVRNPEVVRFPLGESFRAGMVHALRSGQRILSTLKSLVTGGISAKNLAGPIGIFQMSAAYSEIGIMRGLLFLALISINLAILNFLPIPVLDGGWFVFLCIEKIKGSPLSEKTMGYFQWAGLVFVVGLMLFVTWNDIARLFGLM